MGKQPERCLPSAAALTLTPRPQTLKSPHIHSSPKPAHAQRAGSGFKLCLHRILCAPPLFIPHPRACLVHLQREPAPPASLCWLCAHTDPWWPSTAKIWVSTGWGVLVSKPRVVRSLPGECPIPASRPSRHKLRSYLLERRIIAGLWFCSSLKWS